ncbi:hypothetical protein Salat_0608800 [Sesamum alatum]|uniref:Uncharacterized protein n=1 Tax=Sesamum alatum TaxID=300844 RepID=A0AAE1YPX5_9LAMI|nr:hypothetical protein Salat_0608800 [Sesamum alatum]
MEVMIPSENLEFDFNSGKSSPKRFREYYFSAPTSPSQLSQFPDDLDDFFAAGNEDGRGVASAVPFDWEEKPGTPKSPVRVNNGDDFAFDVSQDRERASLSAEELFDGGVIKPLTPPPRMQLPQAAGVSESILTSPRKPISQTRKIVQGAFSPRHKSEERDPFAIAAENAAKEAAGPHRGRERGVSALSKSSSRRAARSLSPLRDGQYPWEEDREKEQQHNAENSSAPANFCSALSASTKGQKKWRLKDFFLFRSASEGRAADKDPLKKYTVAARHSSFRAIESPGSGSRRRGPVSAHELHYTVNRAVSEDLKKKTFLPYKQGIVGRLAFNPTVHALANGFGFSRK